MASRSADTAPVSWLGLVKKTLAKAGADQVTRLGAALAFYTVFSLAPLLLIAVAVAGTVLGPAAARGVVAQKLQGLVGPESARALQAMLANAESGKSGAAGVIGFCTLLFSASYVVSELQASLNLIFGLPSSKIGWRATILGRLISLAFVLSMGFLLLVSLLLSAGISAAGKFLGKAFLPELLLHATSIAVTFVFVSLMFALIYRVLPQAVLRWRDALVGGAVTAGLFELGNVVLGLYLGKGGPTSVYGAAGSILAVVVWSYYCAQIVYYGAEFTYMYAQERGSGIAAKA